jgi:DHA1 family tetracycline resistance protein-like MFS transporter
MLQRIRETDQRMLTILLVVFVQFVGASMAIPILPMMAQREFDLSPPVITRIIASFFVAQFLVSPLLGWLSERYGRVPVLIFCEVGTVVSFIMMFFAQSVPMLFASRIIDGLTGGNTVIAQAYVIDITPKEKRTQALGMLYAAFGIGFVLGPALGGVLSGLFGTRVPFLIAAIGATVVVWMTVRNVNETMTPEQRLSNQSLGKVNLSIPDIFTNLPMLTILLIVFVLQVGFGMLQATFALYGMNVWFAGYDPKIADLGVGLLLSVIGIGQAFTQFFLLRRWIERFGEGGLVVIGNLFRMIAFYLIAIVTMPLLGVPPLFMFSIGTGLLLPSLQSMITKSVEERYRGSALGWFQSVTSLGTIVSTFYGGVLFAKEPTLPFMLGASLNALIVIPSLLLWWWIRNHPEAKADTLDPTDVQQVAGD